MIDALTQIGSPLAETALDDLLKNTADPQEIAQLAKNLEKLAPGAYQSDMLDAARQTLAQNASGNLPGSDVAPLFQVLQHYGGADVVADLEGSANQWNHYAVIALAQLPDGAGVPALIQIATGQEGSSPGTRLAALQTLSGMTSQSADARTSLLDLARQGSLSSYEWAALVPFLAGNQTVYQDSTFGNSVAGISPTQLYSTYLSSSGQSFWVAPLAMTPGQITDQEKFIDTLAAAAKGQAGDQAFNQSKISLETRLGLLANSSAK
jgi:HEAT repeat protein